MQSLDMQISEVTRRDIIDAILSEKIKWSGRFEEQEFLSRLFDLSSLPSNDSRHPDAAGDIWQHCVHNDDWYEDWVFHDDRFNLLYGEDESFLCFLCETIHPVVRPDVTDAARLCQLYNSFLKQDGFQLVEKMRMSGKPVYIGRHVGVAATPGVTAVRETLGATDPGYVAQLITRMETAVFNDPSLAIGTARELVESVCRTILRDRGVDIAKKCDLPQLVKLTSRELELTSDDIPEKAKAADTIKRLLNNLATITQGIAELRNQYGTGHGKEMGTRGLSTRHAKLAVGAASTLAVFLVETHHVRPST